MIPEIPERTSYLSSSVFLAAGLFFIIYPVTGILKNDLILIARPGARGYHLHGLDAAVIGVGVILLGISCLLSATRNIFEEKQRDQYLYRKASYSILYRFTTSLRNLGLFLMVVWSLVSCGKLLIDLIRD